MGTTKGPRKPFGHCAMCDALFEATGEHYEGHRHSHVMFRLGWREAARVTLPDNEPEVQHDQAS